MNEKFLEILKCPKTGKSLKLNIIERFENGMIRTGQLQVENNDIIYPIINGVPRFVDKEDYSSSFGYEWKRWPRVQFDSENIGKIMDGYTEKMFEKITGLKKNDIRNKMFVEFGCGSGRFLEIVRKNNALAVGIDMSLAVDVARNNFREDKNVLIVQGDILNPPFKENIFDMGYSIGVFHHTPNPQDCLKKLIEVIKPRGKIFLSIYSKNGFYDFPSLLFFRKIYKLINKIMSRYIAQKFILFYAFFSAYFIYYIFLPFRDIRGFGRSIRFIEKYLLINLNIPDVKWRILDIFDAITPEYASTHSPEEIKKWFYESGVFDVYATNWGDTSFKGIKS